MMSSNSFLCEMVPFQGRHSFIFGLSIYPTDLMNLNLGIGVVKNCKICRVSLTTCLGGIGHGAIDKTGGFQYVLFSPLVVVLVVVVVVVVVVVWFDV